MSNEKDCELKEVTAIVGEQWYRAKIVDCGSMGVAGAPFPIQPVAINFVPPMKNTDKAWYEAAHRFPPYNGHPEFCEDWNLETGGDSDLGEPLVAPFDGLVINARNFGGAWGKIVRILGRTLEGEVITWMGAHLDEIFVRVGDIVAAGDDIGTIGNADGRYAAHLHEQICVGEVPGPEVFGTDRRYAFRQPSKFYVSRGVDAALMKRLVEFDGE